ncbi:hypothetical protein GCM10010424_37030 [Streptomyces lienomycini]
MRGTASPLAAALTAAVNGPVLSVRAAPIRTATSGWPDRRPWAELGAAAPIGWAACCPDGATIKELV